MKSRILILLIAIAYLFIVFNKSKWKENQVLEWDKSGYYLYLPAVFIHNDLAHFEFYKTVNEKYNITPGSEWYSLHDQPDGKRLNKYPVGVSVLQFPFFLIGHFLTQITHEYLVDGYTSYYLLFLILSGVFYVVWGLWMLRNLLLRYFSEDSVSFVLILIGIGTNLLNYTAFDYGMSHPYSFFLFAGALNSADLFYRKGKARDAILTAAFLGLITIVRPTNILLTIAIAVWGLTGVRDTGPRLQFLRRNIKVLLMSFLCFSAVVLIQLGYWKYATGNWIYFSYQDEGFDFSNPQIMNGLFSYRKGWFVYTPIALVGVLGLVVSLRKYFVMSLGMLLFLCINIYVIFSWHQWYYGGGFGARPLVESLVVVAFPLAALLDYIITKHILVRNSTYQILLLLVVLNLFQTYQFSLGVIPWDHTNKDYYWRVFGKLSTTDEDWKLLHLDE
jgi:hypothetical protein